MLLAEMRPLGQRGFPLALELAGHQPVLRLGQLVLAPGPVAGEVRAFQPLPPDPVHLGPAGLDLPGGGDRQLQRGRGQRAAPPPQPAAPPPGPTTRSPTSPGSGSSVGLSSAASSTSTSGPHKPRSAPMAEFWNPTGFWHGTGWASGGTGRAMGVAAVWRW